MNDALIFFSCSNIANPLGELDTIDFVIELGLGVDRKQHILLTTELQIETPCVILCFHFCYMRFQLGSSTLQVSLGYKHLPRWLSSRESACNAGDAGDRHKWLGLDPWVRKIPWVRAWQPTPEFLPRKSHGQRSLVGYSAWGHKESNTTEVLSTHAPRIIKHPSIIFRLKKKKDVLIRSVIF